MNIIVELKVHKLDLDKTITVTPQWLLNHDEDDLLEELVCKGCNGSEPQGESGKPSCYGECVSRVVEQGYTISYREEAKDKIVFDNGSEITALKLDGQDTHRSNRAKYISVWNEESRCWDTVELRGDLL